MRRAIHLIAFVAAFGLAACSPVPPPPATSPTTTAAPLITTPTTTAPTATTTTAAPGPPGAPVIASFAAAKSGGPAPVTTAFTWSISDPNGDPLTCAIDLDANGSTETVISGCTSSSIRTASFPTSGVQTVRLDVSDGSITSSASVAVNIGATGADAYAITVRFVGSMTTNQQAAFTNAAARWAGLVKGGLYDVTGSFPADDCLPGMPAFSGTIDDLLIDATITPIDGAGGILGSAGPCRIRNTGGLTMYGVMKFDSADVANLEASGLFTATIQHEMGHVLGIGTLWGSLRPGAGTADPTFVGLAAQGSWQAIGGTGAVPVENTGGSGTRDAHWRETTFDHELMTGWLDSGSNPLSRVTVAALGDLGYTVDMTGADAYGLSSLRMFGFGLGGGLDIEHAEQLISPIGEM